MTRIDRRQFLAFALGSAACGGSQPPPAATPEQAFRFVPHVVGANTAITGYGMFEVLETLRDIGFQTVEMQSFVGTLEPTPGEFPGFPFDQLSDEDKERVRTAFEPFEHVTVHLPYDESMPYIDPNDTHGAQVTETCLEGAAYLGAKLAVLHPQPRGTDLEANWDTAVERIRGWGAFAADRGVRLAVETGAPNSLAKLTRFLDEISQDNVGVTLDVGHQAGYEELAHIPESDYATPEAIQAYNDLNVRIVETLGDKLIHLHTHDIEPETWAEHKPLIHGFIDYPRLIASLRKIEYGGVLTFEIGGDPEKMPEYLREGKEKMEAWIAA